ncbi:MAG: glycosyltransferase family 2 protein [Kiritimatiellae bacterium]|nr:glycosyltransferase family 2 protein [Kiritimatiellia bacterium]
MSFSYTRMGIEGREAGLQRFLEILPGATSWCILITMLVLGLSAPQLAAAIVIAFNLYWLLRLAHSTIFLILSYSLLRAESETDWQQRLLNLDQEDIPSRRSRLLHRKRLRALQQLHQKPQDPTDIHHVVIIPIARETADIIEPGLRSLQAQDFPTQRILVMLAVEGRAAENVRRDAAELAARFRPYFLDVHVALHPDGIPDEARVKGANATYAAKQAATILRAHNIPFDRATVSCFDADTVVSSGYFSCLTYHYCMEPHRTRASFQPIPVYHNNIWEAPSSARVLEVGSSFFQLIEATNPETLVTFSSHSMSFQALVEVGYWPVDMISDDSAIFWKSYLHYEGDYRAVPMYTTLSMDVVSADSWLDTLRGLYKQKRRWAWGVENFPLVVRGFLHTPRIAFREKIKHIIKMFEAHISWATWGFMLSAFNWLPALFAGREFSSSVMYFNAPRISGLVFNLAGLALLITIVLSQLLLPRPPSRRPTLFRILHAAEWLLVPVITLFFSALPALDAQTRLMLGRRMEFWVAGKGKKAHPPAS